MALKSRRTLAASSGSPLRVVRTRPVGLHSFPFDARSCFRHLRCSSSDVDHLLWQGDGPAAPPCLYAEARVTLGVTAARDGDLEQALTMGSASLRAIANRCRRSS